MAGPNADLPTPLPQVKNSVPAGLPSFSEALESACGQPASKAELAPSAESADAGDTAPAVQTQGPKAPGNAPQVKSGVSSKQILLLTSYRTLAGPVSTKVNSTANLTTDADPAKSETAQPKTTTSQKQQADEEKPEVKKAAPHAPAAELVRDTADLSAAAQQAAAGAPDPTQAPAAAQMKPVPEENQAKETVPVADVPGVASTAPAASSGELAVAVRITTGDTRDSNPAPGVSSDADKTLSDVTPAAGHPAIAITRGFRRAATQAGSEPTIFRR